MNKLLVFRNKKVNNFDYSNKLINEFSSIGYYFDAISYIAFDKSAQIVRALKDGKANYENLIIICPAQMENVIKTFVAKLYNTEFDETGILETQNSNVIILYNDRENVLLLSKIKKLLDEKYGVSYSKSYIKTVGATFNEINNAINKVKSLYTQLNFNVSDSFSNCTIEITYPDTISKSDLDKLMRILVTELCGYVYAMDNLSLAEQVFQLLKLRKMKISVAESFTGGGVGQKLVEVPGVSEVFFEGLNTYSNDSKMNRLKVNDCTLHQFGAVSKETAYEMAKGLIDSGNCDICIATTGIAGPASDNTSKPVGLVYIAVGTNNSIQVYEYNLKGDRENITKTAINIALFLAYKTLK